MDVVSSKSPVASPEPSPRYGQSSGVPIEIIETIYKNSARDAATNAPESVQRMGASYSLSPRRIQPTQTETSYKEFLEALTLLSEAIVIQINCGRDQISQDALEKKIESKKKLQKALSQQRSCSNLPTGFSAITENAKELSQSNDVSLFDIQKSILLLTKLANSDDSLKESTPHIIDTLLKDLQRQGLKIFAKNEIDLYKSDPFYELPAKPVSEESKRKHETVLEEMASYCDELVKNVEKTSSEVYQVSIKGHKPLFIFKPESEESESTDEGRFLKGEGATREYLSARYDEKCALATVQGKKGFLIEYYPRIIGSIDQLHHGIPDEVETLKKNLHILTISGTGRYLKRVTTVEKLKEIGITPEQRQISQLEIWNHPNLDKITMQEMMLKCLWNFDTDLNPGNFLLQAFDLESEFSVCRIINIDRGRTMPNIAYSDAVDIWTPGWINSRFAKEPIDDRVKNDYLQKKPLEEVRIIKSMLIHMEERAAVLLLLCKWYIQVGIEQGLSIQTIATGFIQNKVYEIMLEKNSELTLNDCGKKTYIAFKSKFLAYYRTCNS